MIHHGVNINGYTAGAHRLQQIVGRLSRTRQFGIVKVVAELGY
ncbi:hypothetical protein ACIP1U_31745 [Cupriavidus sp. NPDC089707]